MRTCRRVVESVQALTELALPVACAACGAAGAGCCARCRAALDLSWFGSGPQVVARVGRPGGPPVPCVAAGDYDGVARALLHAFKDGGRRDLAPVLAPGLLAAALALLSDAGGGGARSRPEPDRHVLLVPAPSAGRAERRRGDRPLVLLADLAARSAPATTPSRLDVAAVLRTARPVADQAGLGRAARAANVAGAFALRRGADVRGAGVVLVDDVLTTGATAAEAVRVLDAAGANVIGVATALATGRRAPPRGSRRRSTVGTTGPGGGSAHRSARNGSEMPLSTR